MSDNPYSKNERTKCVNTNTVKPPKILITGKHDVIKYNILIFDELIYLNLHNSTNLYLIDTMIKR